MSFIEPQKKKSISVKSGLCFNQIMIASLPTQPFGNLSLNAVRTISSWCGGVQSCQKIRPSIFSVGRSLKFSNISKYTMPIIVCSWGKIAEKFNYTWYHTSIYFQIVADEFHQFMWIFWSLHSTVFVIHYCVNMKCCFIKK